MDASTEFSLGQGQLAICVCVCVCVCCVCCVCVVCVWFKLMLTEKECNIDVNFSDADGCQCVTPVTAPNDVFVADRVRRDA